MGRDASGSFAPLAPPEGRVFLGTTSGLALALAVAASLDTLTAVYDSPMAFVFSATPWYGEPSFIVMVVGMVVEGGTGGLVSKIETGR